MSYEVDLIEALAAKRAAGSAGPVRNARYRASILTTFNAYLPFYEEVVLRRLVAAGCQHNVLLMDARQWASELDRPLNRPRFSGLGYTLIPIRASGAFHPKVGLLAGEKHARVVVGSHNMTLSGFGLNRELTTRIDLSRTSDHDRAIAANVWGYLHGWVRAQEGLVPDEVLESAGFVRDRFAPWLSDEGTAPGDLRFFGSGPTGPDLWEQLGAEQYGRATQVIAIGAFFDHGFRLLRTVRDRLRPDAFIVGIEPDTVGMDPTAGPPEGITFVDVDQLGEREGYLHAKALFVSFEDGRALLAIGSANLSAPAWLDGPTRNAEALLLREGREAREWAGRIGLTDLAELPPLEDGAWDDLRRRLVSAAESEEEPSAPLATVAVRIDEGFFLPSLDLPSTVDTIAGVSLSLGDLVVAGSSLERTATGMLVRVDGEEWSQVRMLELRSADIVLCRATVHDPPAIHRNLRTGAQQSFRDALDGLTGDSPDIASVVRFAERLIFTEDGSASESRSSTARPKNTADGDEGKRVIESLVVQPQIREAHRRPTHLRSDDLGYVIDVLVRSLGEGLGGGASHDAVDALTEEEQIGSDSDSSEDLDRLQMLERTVETCQTKVRSLVRRMIAQLERAHAGEQSAGRCLQQLLAVLSVLRELRRYDDKLRVEGVTNTVVPIDQRRLLIEKSLSLLLERGVDLLAAGMAELGDEAASDIATLSGLFLWLAWDAGLDLRSSEGGAVDLGDTAEDTWLLDRARLVAILPMVADSPDAAEMARTSIIPSGDAAGRRADRAARWVDAHLQWGAAVLDSYRTLDEWPSASADAGRGMLAVATGEEPPRIRLIRSAAGRSVHLVDVGESHGLRARDFVPFAADRVVVAPDPQVTM